MFHHDGTVIELSSLPFRKAEVSVHLDNAKRMGLAAELGKKRYLARPMPGKSVASHQRQCFFMEVIAKIEYSLQMRGWRDWDQGMQAFGCLSVWASM